MKKLTTWPGLRGVARIVKQVLARNRDSFLRKCKGVIHVGANDGGERDLYRRYSLKVLWVEASPDAYQTLSSNLRNYPNQTAVNALVTDKDGETCDFHISNNAGLSSSIFDFRGHKKLWPEVSFTKTIQLRSSRLSSLLKQAGCIPSDFDALILDVQGAELLVVAGAGEILDSLHFIKAEAADFESYQGACTVQTLTEFLTARGFGIRRKKRFAGKRGVGTYYDVLYERQPAAAH